RFRMRRLANRAHDERGCDQSVRWGDEFDVGTLLLEEDVGGVFTDRSNLVVAFGEPVEQLHARIKRMRVLLCKLFPEAGPIEFAQRVPLHELQSGRRNLAADN